MDESGPAAAGGETAEWSPSVNPWLITAAVMLPTFMEVLDTTIASVALPHIAGSLSASNEEASWVLTSYLVANAIILPASGWLAGYFGRRRFLIACIVIFTITSFLSGAALTLDMLVVARVFQGAGGGALQPLSQAILLESFPREKRGMAMAAFGLGVVVAPIVGPTLGGWLTDNFSWRWAFYVNIPVGVLAVIMIRAFVEDPPYVRGARPGGIDRIGFGLMALALGTLQIILDRGQQDDWFAAGWIRWFAAISVLALLLFIFRELTTKNPIVNLRVFADRNFAAGTLLITLVGVALYSAITLIPLFLQTLMGYTALQSGIAVATRGLGALLTMPVVGYLTGVVDFRRLIACGFCLVAASLWLIGGLNLEIAMWQIAWPSIVTGVGLAMVFVPLSAVAMGTLPQSEISNASGVFNLMRNVGGSFGISLFATFIARQSQVHQATLVARLTPENPIYQQRLLELQQHLAARLGPAEAHEKALGVIYRSVERQSGLLAFMGAFRTLAIIALGCIGLVLLLQRVEKRGPPGGH
jgi:MFS transporter, DHA2 family, multidrug resistance protein